MTPDSQGNVTVVKTHEIGIGPRMLELANWLAAYTYAVERDPATFNPALNEFLRGHFPSVCP